MTPTIVAVYGTLRRGCHANGLMRGCRFVGPNVINGRIYDLVSFPALKLDKAGPVPVTVDLYELPGDESPLKLTEIDRYEGCFPGKPDQSLFNRVKTVTVGREVTWVWTYEFRLDVSPFHEIKSGDWLAK